jgi:hypothetical protein
MGDPRPIEVIFDQDQKHQGNAKSLYKAHAETMGFSGRISNVTFEDEKRFLPLQSADLLAWHIRRSLCFPDEDHSEALDKCFWSSMDRPFQTTISRPFLEAMQRDIIENSNATGLRLVEKNVGTAKKPKLIMEAVYDPESIRYN